MVCIVLKMTMEMKTMNNKKDQKLLLVYNSQW